jgi:hypothetical protein
MVGSINAVNAPWGLDGELAKLASLASFEACRNIQHAQGELMFDRILALLRAPAADLCRRKPMRHALGALLRTPRLMARIFQEIEEIDHRWLIFTI